MYSLDQLKIGQKAKILSVCSESCLKQRLLDLGFLDGTIITCLHQNHSGDFKAYGIRKTVIALRKEDAKTILLCKEQI